MRYASKNDIEQLIQTPKNSKAISIFMPTHRISLPHNLKADRVRMKNAIKDTVATLEKQGVSSSNIKDYVTKLHELQNDNKFWKYRDNGLAIYAEKGKIMYYDMPIEIEYNVHIGNDYIITPLIVAEGTNYQYNILELNNREPRFFLSGQSSIDRAFTDELPGDLETALKIDEYQQRQQHSTSPGGSRDAHGHGHGGIKDNKSKDVTKYYRMIDKILWDNQLKNSNLPLIIAGDTSSMAEYKKLSKYDYIHEQSLHGNHEHTSENELHDKSWEIMVEQIENQNSVFRKVLEKAKFRDGKQILVNGAHIRKAAREGRIATLAISIIHKTYDSVVRRMEQRFKIALPSNMKQLKNIEQSARDVLQNGGQISAVFINKKSSNSTNHTYLEAITR